MCLKSTYHRKITYIFLVTSSVQEFYAPLRENAHSTHSERCVIELLSISHPVRCMSDICFVTYTLSNMCYSWLSSVFSMRRRIQPYLQPLQKHIVIIHEKDEEHWQQPKILKIFPVIQLFFFLSAGYKTSTQIQFKNRILRRIFESKAEKVEG